MAVKKGGKQPNEHKYSINVENEIRKGIQRGLSIQVIFDSIQHWDSAPASMTTFYKHYGWVMGEERAKLQGEIGDAVMQKVREGDSNMIQFAAKTKGNWVAPVKVQEVDPDEIDENKDAISELARLLGKN